MGRKIYHVTSHLLLVQLKLLEKRLAKDPHLRNQYSKVIENDLSKGYVIQISPHNFSNRSIHDEVSFSTSRGEPKQTWKSEVCP